MQIGILCMPTTLVVAALALFLLWRHRTNFAGLVLPDYPIVAECAVEFRCGAWLSCFFMSKPACPMCEMTEVLDHPERWECVTCGHEWLREAQLDAPDAVRVVKDAHGKVLANGDCVVLIKDLKLGSGSQVLKGGSKSKPIRLVEGDHEISCKMDGISIGLKACFVKKA